MIKKLLIYCVLALGIIAILTFYADKFIKESSKRFLFSDSNKIPIAQTAVLLGTSRMLGNGNKNEYFFNRISAAVGLFKQGKIKNIIVSGDNSKVSYNEPLDMKNELIANGIPDSIIYLDYAGFRTFDSMIRARDIFGQNAFVVISQKFHNERAVYIARRNNIQAIGYNAADVETLKGFKTMVREYFARDKVFLDILFVLHPDFQDHESISGSIC